MFLNLNRKRKMKFKMNNGHGQRTIYSVYLHLNFLPKFSLFLFDFIWVFDGFL